MDKTGRASLFNDATGVAHDPANGSATWHWKCLTTAAPTQSCDDCDTVVFFTASDATTCAGAGADGAADIALVKGACNLSDQTARASLFQADGCLAAAPTGATLTTAQAWRCTKTPDPTPACDTCLAAKAWAGTTCAAGDTSTDVSADDLALLVTACGSTDQAARDKLFGSTDTSCHSATLGGASAASLYRCVEKVVEPAKTCDDCEAA